MVRTPVKRTTGMATNAYRHVSRSDMRNNVTLSLPTQKVHSPNLLKENCISGVVMGSEITCYLSKLFKPSSSYTWCYIWWGESWSWSLLGVKGLRTTQIILCTDMSLRWYIQVSVTYDSREFHVAGKLLLSDFARDFKAQESQWNYVNAAARSHRSFIGKFRCFLNILSILRVPLNRKLC